MAVGRSDSDPGAGTVGIQLQVVGLFLPQWILALSLDRTRESHTSQSSANISATIPLCSSRAYFSITTVQQWECWEK